MGKTVCRKAKLRWGKTFKHIRNDIELRLIGPLQSNKALDAVKLFDVIETLDRMSLAKALVRAADKHGSLPSAISPSEYRRGKTKIRGEAESATIISFRVKKRI